MASITGLAACGGASTSGDGVVTEDATTEAGTTETSVATADGDIIDAETFEQFADRIDTLLEAIPDDLDFTSDENLKTNGSAEFHGVLGVFEFEIEEPTYLAFGEASIIVDFTDGSATGSGDNFFEVDLVVSDLDSDSSEDIIASAIVGDFDVVNDGDGIAGTLTKLSGEVAEYEIGVDYSQYYGENAEEISVEGSGTSFATGRADVDAGFAFTGIDTAILD